MPDLSPLLEQKLAHLPTGPGVYQHKDAEGTVLYVGKAKNLRNRVRSYFQESRPREGRLQALVRKIADVELIVTDTEAEALILENNLIKKLKPRYNVNLRDDKTYPWIVITNEPFPRVFPTRRVVRDGSKYFGPYTDVKNMKRVLKAVRSLFKVRMCSLALAPEPIAAGRFEACLEYHIKKCDAPCIGEQSLEEYQEMIGRVEKLLSGHTDELKALLTADMQRLASGKRFEEAAARRDQLHAVQVYAQKQKVVTADGMDRDVFALACDREADVACGVVFQIREGKIIGRDHHYLRKIEGHDEASLMQRLLESYYTQAAFFPTEVLLSDAAEDADVIEEYLREHRGRKVALRVPQRGDKAELMDMASQNARLLLLEWKRQKALKDEAREDRVPRSVQSLKRDLNLPREPRRIECFDISHLGGTGTVASCVVFEKGAPKKSEYRHYKIRTVEDKPDDFQSMREVIGRRYAKVVEENGPWPDLVVIDGGKGQLSSAVAVLKEVEAYGKFTVVGLAKRLEEVFFPGDSQPVLIPRTSSSLQLLQRVRNEAHRFAVTFQRKQRQLSTLKSELTDIPGIGAGRARKLLTEIGSVKKVREASEDALAAVVGPAAARKVRDHFDAQTSDASAA
jgi:excinuclease ABC subunit C